MLTDVTFPPPLSSWRHVCVCRGRWWAVWSHHSIPQTFNPAAFHRHQSSAEAHTEAHLRLRPQITASSRNHARNDQTPSTDGHRISNSPCYARNSPTYGEGAQHHQTPSDWRNSWDDHRSCHDSHHRSPRPRRRGLQREAFWLLHATKKWLHIRLQRWVTRM